MVLLKLNGRRLVLKSNDYVKLKKKSSKTYVHFRKHLKFGVGLMI